MKASRRRAPPRPPLIRSPRTPDHSTNNDPTVEDGQARVGRRGRAVFEGKGQCLTCHQVNGIGSRLGPDLSEVGRLGRASEIEQAVLDPRREVLPQNRTVTVTTRDGARVSGRLLHHDTFTVLLLDSEENLRSFDKSNVRDVTVIKTNPMPSYRGTLTDQEVADLVGYLVSLKGTRALTP